MPFAVRTKRATETGYWTLVAHIPGRGFETVCWWQDRIESTSPPSLNDALTAARRIRPDELALIFAPNMMDAWHSYRNDYRERHPRQRKAA